MPDLDLAERLPEALPAYDGETDFAAWLRAHQDEVDSLDVALDDVQRSLQVAHATGDALDRIGADFGLLGRRRVRDDQAYRQLLQSLVQAYSGRGTPPGVRTAIAAGVLIDAADVELIEDFDANRYEVRLHEWTSHRTETVDTLASLSDPSVIQRRDPIHYVLDAGDAVGSGSSTTSTTTSVGLSAGDLGGLSTGSFTLG
jgi:hypothetical protein